MAYFANACSAAPLPNAKDRVVELCLILNQIKFQYTYPPDKSLDKSPDKSPDKSMDKSPDKSPDKSMDKSPDKYKYQYLNKDIIEMLIKLIMKIEPPQILYNARIYNLYRTYDNIYLDININKNKNIELNKFNNPLIRCIDRKFNNSFRIYLENLAVLNDNLLKVLNKEKPININRRVQGRFHQGRFYQGRFHQGRFNQGGFHQIIYRRYLLAFTKIKKYRTIHTDKLIIDIYNKFDNIFTYNCKNITI